MTDTEVVTLLPRKVLDNLSEKDDQDTDTFIDFNKYLEWENHDFDFYDEYEDHLSFKDEGKSESDDAAEVDDEDETEGSNITIVTPEESGIELSVISEESSIYFCFREIDISDSQLKIRNVFNLYSVPNDPGSASAFWGIYRRPKVYSEDVEKFNDIVKVLGLRPISCLKDLFKETEINLRYYGFDPRIFKAICETLVDNNLVQSLDLKAAEFASPSEMTNNLYVIVQDNYLTLDACYHLNELLQQNTLLTSINLSGCRIGPLGAKKIEEGLSFATALQHLNLSKCEIGDEGIENISRGVYLNEVLQTLDLSDNHLSQGSAKDLEAMILKSETLMNLNLSWNSLYHKETSKGIFHALTDAKKLEEINLSWNGLGSESTPYLCSFLSKPSKLQVLNLNGNQFTDIEATQIAKFLSKNSNLEKFDIGNNPLKATGGSELIKSLILEKAPESRINLLDLENIWVNKNIVATLQDIENTKPWLNIKLGGIFNNFKLVGPDERKIFLKRANFEAMNTKKKKERKEFGHFVLSLGEIAIPIATFVGLVKASKLKLSDTLVLAIAKAFAIGKNLIDQGELKAFYLKEYPETQPPPEKEKKIKKGKNDKKRRKEEKGNQAKSEEAPEAMKKEIKFKDKKMKPKSKTEKVPSPEIVSQEYEFEDLEDKNLEEFEPMLEF